jgi:hypothetical protein
VVAATTSGSDTAEARQLVARLDAELEPLAERIVARIRDDIPDFRQLPADALRRAVIGNLGRVLAALAELRSPTPGELEGSASVARERAEQGLAVGAVLQAHRVTVNVVWTRFGELAREHGTGVASVLAFSETLWRWADALMDVVAAAHREVELQLARDEQQRRDAFVLAVLNGTLEPAELRRDGAAFGLDPERLYVPFRARTGGGESPHRRSRRLALALAGDEGAVASLDGDLVGIAAQPPVPLPGITTGVGPPARLTAVAGAFAAACRALQTATAFGQEGVYALSDLSIRPAILLDEELGDAFRARYLEPLAGMGRLGAELETTLRAWFENGMRIEDTARALYVHPNTLRHRIRRFEEATGADLRRPADLIELWWALEREGLRSEDDAGE